MKTLDFGPFLVCLILVGCATHLPDVVLTPATKTVNVPKELLIKCAPIKSLTATKYSEAEIVGLVKSLVDQSDECRQKHSILVDAVKKAFNIDTSK